MIGIKEFIFGLLLMTSTQVAAGPAIPLTLYYQQLVDHQPHPQVQPTPSQYGPKSVIFEPQEVPIVVDVVAKDRIDNDSSPSQSPDELILSSFSYPSLELTPIFKAVVPYQPPRKREVGVETMDTPTQSPPQDFQHSNQYEGRGFLTLSPPFIVPSYAELPQSYELTTPTMRPSPEITYPMSFTIPILSELAQNPDTYENPFNSNQSQLQMQNPVTLSPPEPTQYQLQPHPLQLQFQAPNEASNHPQLQPHPPQPIHNFMGDSQLRHLSPIQIPLSHPVQSQYEQLPVLPGPATPPSSQPHSTETTPAPTPPTITPPTTTPPTTTPTINSLYDQDSLSPVATYAPAYGNYNKKPISALTFVHIITPHGYSAEFKSENGIDSKEEGHLKQIQSAQFSPASESTVGVVHVKSGQVIWTSPECITFKLSYVADEHGYRPTITETLATGCVKYGGNVPSFEQPSADKLP